MIDVHIKQMSGELLTIKYDNEWSTERLHDCVYEVLHPENRPLENEKWKMMLFHRGEWIIANKRSSVVIDDGEVLDLLIDSGTYDIDFPLEDYRGELWRNMLQIRGSINVDFPFYVNEETGFYYFDDEIEQYQELYHLKNPYSIPHVDAHEFINTLDIPLCLKEVIYSRYYWCYYTIIPSNAPLPISYYCNYKCTTDENGDILIEDHPQNENELC